MRPDVRPIVCFGSSGNALTLRDLMRRTATLASPYEVVAYIDDYRGDTGLALDGVPIVGFETWRREMRDVPVLVTLGDPRARRTVAERLRAAGARLPAVYDRDELGDVVVGEGSFVAAGSRFGVGTAIGTFAQTYPFVTVPPHARIGDYVTLCPRATLRGRVTIGDGVFVGASALLDAGEGALHIGSGVRIAAGTSVRTSVPAGRRVYGDPMRQIDGMHVID